MSAQESQMPQQLQQIAQELSMELGIPLVGSPVDLVFASQCTNAILSGLNPSWKPIHFDTQSEGQIDKHWARLFRIVESAFLVEGQKLLEDNEQIGLENIMMLYQVLHQGCQAMKQQSMSPSVVHQQLNNNQSSPKKQRNTKKQQKHQIKLNKSKPKAAVPKRPQKTVKLLQDEIVENVRKTMARKYAQTAQPRRRARIRQKQGTQAVEKAKRTLDYALKDYEISNRLNANKKQRQPKHKKGEADSAYMKIIEGKHKKLNEQIQNKQLSYYLELRDKKVAYIRHIHKLIEKLQKQRQIEWKKQQKQAQQQSKKQIMNKIEHADNLFKTNMDLLSENYQHRKKVQQLESVGELEVCMAMEKTIKQKKMKELEEMRNLWVQQRNQLHKITSDEEKMKNKLIEIYRKYRV